MENKTYEINVYDWLISELAKANDQLSTISGEGLTYEECDSLDVARFAIIKCIGVIKELKEKEK